MTETFRASGYELDRTDAVLEPSYICEALGLQGRLDYMQRDMTSFIEMKSGKADEYSIRGKVEPKENNKVQDVALSGCVGVFYGNGPSTCKGLPALIPVIRCFIRPRPSWAMVRRVMDVRTGL